RPERWDVVLRLWDPVPAVRDLAFATMQGWNDGFAMAIPSLLARSADGDRAFAAACSRAIDRWAAKAPPVATAAVAALRGHAAEGALPEPTAADRTMLAELVMGCRGLGSGELGRLATFVNTHRLTDGRIVDAFLWCVAAHDEAAWRSALQALVVLGPPVVAVRPDLATQLIRSTVIVSALLEEVGPLVEAWVRAGPAATTSELLTAIGCDNWCVCARALAEVVQRGGAPGRAIVDEAAAAPGRDFAGVHVAQGVGWAQARRHGSGHAHITMKPDRELVAALATLVLLAAGDERWREPSMLQACLERCGGGATAESLRAATPGELPALSRKLEARLRPRWLEPR
ncbi:MAG TPA: hypothetical protein VFT55_14875, partial [Planctomycetota bacterium]|nr:hypothetical protein [Planctomycetota bacterium]